MLKHIGVLLLLAGCTNASIETAYFDDHVVNEISKYKVNTSEMVSSGLASGFDFAVGSSLQFKEKDKDGNLLFYSISDRGPNFPYIDNEDGAVKLVSFLQDFTPTIALIEVKPKVSAQIINTIPLHKDGERISGLPFGSSGQHEQFIDHNMEHINSEKFGLDTESLALTKDGNFWVGDEYGPSLNYVDNTGGIVKSYTPGEGLPLVFKNARHNRGFETVAVADNGKVYALLEAPIDVIKDGVKISEKFIRMLELDPKTGETRVFAYPWDKEIYATPGKMKVSDLAAIGNKKFLIVEQGEDLNQKNRNAVYKINIKDATDISSWEVGADLDLQNVSTVKREFLLDARKYGWAYEKLEGLTIVDNRTIAFSNDSDFDLQLIHVDKKCDKIDCTMITPIFSESNSGTNLWVVSLFKNIDA